QTPHDFCFTKRQRGNGGVLGDRPKPARLWAEKEAPGTFSAPGYRRSLDQLARESCASGLPMVPGQSADRRQIQFLSPIPESSGYPLGLEQLIASHRSRAPGAVPVECQWLDLRRWNYRGRVML